MLWLTAGSLLMATACRRDRVFRDMSDSTFVRTMVALRKLPVGSSDPARERQRDSILAAFGITGAQLESTAVRLADDPPRASEIWSVIQNPVPPSPPSPPSPP